MNRFLILWLRMAVILLLMSLLGACSTGNIPSTGSTAPASGNAPSDPYASDPYANPTATQPVSAPNANAPAPTATVGQAVAPVTDPTSTTQAVAEAAPTSTTAAVLPTATLQAAAPAPAVQRVELTTPYRLSPMVGAAIQTADGQFIGEIQNLIVDRGGTIRYAILETNELLAPGERKVIIPWTAFKAFNIQQNAFAQNALVLNVSPQSVLGAPPLTIDEENIAFVANWEQSIQTYWQGQNVPIPVTGAPAGVPLILEADGGGIDVNSGTIDLGSIEDMIVDPATGTIRYAVLEPDDDLALGLGPHYIPIPWRALNFVTQDDVTLNVPPARLAQAPFFDVWETLDFNGPFDATWNTFWQ